MGKFTNDTLQQIKSRVSIVDVVRAAVPSMKKKGRDWWACCPFHGEKTPSFTIREREGQYHCFGCGAHGDIFTFVQETRGGSFADAVEHLAAQSGIKVEREGGDYNPEDEKRKADGFTALERSVALYNRNLTGNSLKYLQNRGITAETIDTFNIGWAEDSRDAYGSAMTSDGFASEVLVAAGMQIQPDDAKRAPYDRFRGRVMFPIQDLQGRTVGFGGRIVGDGEPKYLNSPDSKFFNKRFVVYNLNRARDHIKAEGRLLLVEGYMDAIGLWQAGVKTAVAPMGTAVTEDQVQILWRFHNNPTVCLDGDNAGRNAASKLARRVLPILKPGSTLQFAWMPDGEDPDSFVQANGVDKFNELIAKTTSLEDVLWQEVAADKDMKTGDGRAAAEAVIQEIVKDIANETVAKHYAKALKDRLWQGARSGKAAFITGKRKGLPITAKNNAGRLALAVALRNPQLILQNEEVFLGLSLESENDRLIKNVLTKALIHNGVELAEVWSYLMGSDAAENVEQLIQQTLVDALLNGRSEMEVANYWRDLCTEAQVRSNTQQSKNTAKAHFAAELNDESWQKLKAQYNKV